MEKLEIDVSDQEGYMSKIKSEVFNIQDNRLLEIFESTWSLEEHGNGLKEFNLLLIVRLKTDTNHNSNSNECIEWMDNVNKEYSIFKDRKSSYNTTFSVLARSESTELNNTLRESDSLLRL
jgi:hypothetical protein